MSDIPSAIASPARTAFPDAPMAPTPDPYGGAMHPDDEFAWRNSCDTCEAGIDVGEDMVVTRTLHGTIETFCPLCFLDKYGRYFVRCKRRPCMHDFLVYVNVLQGGNFYRWEKDA